MRNSILSKGLSLLIVLILVLSTGLVALASPGTGDITTVAGTGVNGYNGDNVPATSAQLGYPNGVAVDISGNLFIADPWYSIIRKVDTSGIITTVAGTGAWGYSGDNVTATSAQLNWPRGVDVDSSGNLFIADYSNNRIRKVDTSGTITTVAGTGTLGYSGDNVPATSAQLRFPIGVAVDSSGNLFIADQSNNRIRKVEGPPVYVGGEVAPIDKVGVLSLWLGLALIMVLAVGAGSFVLVRRRARKA